MSMYMIDPQMERGHPCEICGCECFGDPICQKCRNRMEDEE